MHNSLTLSPSEPASASAIETLEFHGIHLAITKNDPQALERLAQRTRDAERYRAILSQCIGNDVFEADLSPKHQAVTLHAALWMLPIVLSADCLPPQSSNMKLSNWVGEFFGKPLFTSSVQLLVSISSVVALKPTEIYALLRLLSRDRVTNSKSRAQPPTLVSSTALPGIPTLQFMVGCVQRVGETPPFPRDSNFDWRDRVVKGIWAVSPDALMKAEKGVEVGVPAPFTEAVTQGILLWLDALEQAWCVKSWTLDPLGGDTLMLKLLVMRRGTRECKVLSHLLQHWQLGLNGLDEIMNRCTVWPMDLQSSSGRKMPS